LAARRGAASAGASFRSRPACQAVAPRRDASAGLGQDAGTELAADAWQQITWRNGSNTPLTSRFARLRVGPAHDDARRNEPADAEWLLIEWPDGETEPNHYWLSTLPSDISLERLVDLTKVRWRIERDYLELKQEVGLGHYEGRRWRGFHHHASFGVAAHGFLVSEKQTIPPQDLPAPGEARNLPFPTVTDPEDLPLRSQRHMPNSIAMLRIRLARTLVLLIPCCPCCGRARQWPVEQNE
jgi:SRSO17 transposase